MSYSLLNGMRPSKAEPDEEEEEMNLSWLVNSSADKIFKSIGYGRLDDPPGPELPIEKIVYDPDFRYTKPGHTYTELIEKALREKKRMTVSELYAWIHENYPYFKENDGRWKNSVRHNLSISPQFKKEGKNKNGSYFWVLSEEYEEEMKKMNEVRKVISEAKRRQLEMRAAKRAARKKQIAVAPMPAPLPVQAQPQPSPMMTQEVCEDPLLINAATDILRGVQRKVVVKYMDDDVAAPKTEEDDVAAASACTYISNILEGGGLKTENIGDPCTEIAAEVELDSSISFLTDFSIQGIEIFDCEFSDLREEEVSTSILTDDGNMSVCTLLPLTDISQVAESLCTTDEGYADEFSDFSE